MGWVDSLERKENDEDTTVVGENYLWLFVAICPLTTRIRYREHREVE